MSYVYDILVNFKYPLIPFYEWNKNDSIENIKKIPLYKISSDNLYNMKNNKFKLCDINEIKGNTKLFNNKKLFNASIYTDGKEAVVFNFNNNGICIGKSCLLIEEENEILDNSNLIDEVDIKYEIISKDKLNNKTRREEYITSYLLKEISKISDIDKLNYIYYECFDNPNELSKDVLIKMIKNNWDDKYYKIYEFLTLISMNKH